MRERIKPTLRNILENLEVYSPRFCLSVIEHLISRPKLSYSFYGEDLVIQGLLARFEFENGFKLSLSYIDIGAWRPIQGSNTYQLYRTGAYGTAVEPNPHFKRIWKTVRPKDSFLPLGCSNMKTQSLKVFHRSAASNTLSESFAEKISTDQNLGVDKVIEVQCMTLQEIIQKHLESNGNAFLLDIDIEGMDEEIITTFNFPKHLRPSLILVEDPLREGGNTQNSKIAEHLVLHHYILVGRTVLTSIFVDSLSILGKTRSYI